MLEVRDNSIYISIMKSIFLDNNFSRHSEKKFIPNVGVNFGTFDDISCLAYPPTLDMIARYSIHIDRCINVNGIQQNVGRLMFNNRQYCNINSHCVNILGGLVLLT